MRRPNDTDRWHGPRAAPLKRAPPFWQSQHRNPRRGQPPAEPSLGGRRRPSFGPSSGRLPCGAGCGTDWQSDCLPV